ncbi:unnamed protein product [Symbiodinium natans]|uniref:Uncharacterized protein n=1 Tax=Symbiodinium natans TaxID=878477 RepID=A0A812UXD7_9DINO|nr:unnamed protein product [Symbiodinium natans]
MDRGGEEEGGEEEGGERREEERRRRGEEERGEEEEEGGGGEERRRGKEERRREEEEREEEREERRRDEEEEEEEEERRSRSERRSERREEREREREEEERGTAHALKGDKYKQGPFTLSQVCDCKLAQDFSGNLCSWFLVPAVLFNTGWNVVLSLPSASDSGCIVYKYPAEAEEEDACSVEIAGLTLKIRLFTVLTNLLPRTLLQCVFFVVGIEYLLSVTKIEDLILNSLALMVLVTIDEMLFVAFTGEQNAIWIQNCEPLEGTSFKWLDWLLSATHMPVGLLIFVPITATLAGYILNHVTMMALQAQATSCLCDLKGDSCFAPRFLAGRLAAAASL